MRWHERPIAQTTLMIAVMVGVVVLQNAVVTQVLPQFSAQKNTPSDDLQKVSANTCPFDSGQAPRNTLTDQLDVARWPISTNRHEYDMLGPGYFDLVPENNAGILDLSASDNGQVDEKAANLMSNMFGFKPAKLSAAYKLKYASAPQGGDGEYKGPGPVLEVPVDPADPTVKVPNNIQIDGDGSVAMVVFAASDRLTIHLARSEHIYDAKYSSGYWIYLKNICVDQQIISKYNLIKAAQESAGANKDKIFLPMLRPGHILGKALPGNKVLVAVRDNGPLISIFKPFYWGGVPVKNTLTVGPDGSSATATPAAAPGAATSTPVAVLPTATPITATSTPTPGAASATPKPTGSLTPSPARATATPIPPTTVPTTAATVATPTPVISTTPAAGSSSPVAPATIILTLAKVTIPNGQGGSDMSTPFGNAEQICALAHVMIKVSPHDSSSGDDVKPYDCITNSGQGSDKTILTLTAKGESVSAASGYLYFYFVSKGSSGNDVTLMLKLGDQGETI